VTSVQNTQAEDIDPVSGLLHAWSEKRRWFEIDFGPGRWSDEAMTMYDRASGFTWLQIVERRNRGMFWWDDLDVCILEYPGGVDIPLWPPGQVPPSLEEVDDATAQRRVRNAVIRAMKKAVASHPELEAARKSFLRECLSLQDPGPLVWATAKEWIRPGER